MLKVIVKEQKAYIAVMGNGKWHKIATYWIPRNKKFANPGTYYPRYSEMENIHIDLASCANWNVKIEEA